MGNTNNERGGFATTSGKKAVAEGGGLQSLACPAIEEADQRA